MNINKNHTAVVLTDPHNDVLSEKGVAWELVGNSSKENNTVENIERVLKAAKENGFENFIFPTITIPQTWYGQSAERLRT